MADIQSNINVNIDTSSALASIKALQAQISAFHTSMAKGSATATAASSQLQQKLLDSVNATGAFRASIQSVKSTTESFTTALEKNKLSLGQYFKYSIASTKSFGNAFKTEMGVIDKVARERVKDLQTQYISLGRDANGALKSMSIRPLILDLENLQTKTAMAAQKQQILNQLLKQGSTNLLNFGKNTQWAGRQLMVGFTIPLSMAGTAAAKAYMDIEKASIKIKRVYGDLSTTAKETNAMVDSIKNLAAEYTKYGIAVADTMEMAAKAAAMGKTGADLLAQVNESTRLAALGGVDQEAALETTISLTSAFGTSTEQLAAKINYLNAVENQTVTSIEDLTIAIPKAGPVVKQLGGDVEDLAFFLTAMREGGINASEGANALKSGLAALINPTTKASEMLAGFGINIKAIVEGNKGDLKKTVIDFATALNTIDPLNRARAIEQMFGKFQFARISTLLQNVTSSSSQASKAVALANMSSIQLAAMSRKELDRVAASPMYKFQKAIADLQVKIAPVGEAFLKAVTPIVSWVAKVLEGFNGMSEQFKSFTVIGVAVLGGLAPVLLMVIGLVANGAANIIKLFANIKAFLNKTTSASQVLGETTNYLTTEQIKAEAVAASLDQIHTKLKQTFTAEAGAVDMLTAALQRSVTAQMNFAGAGAGKKAPAKNLAGGGMVYGPGTKTSDSIPANLSNGEAVIDADTVAKNPAVMAALFAGQKINIPGYSDGKTVPLFGEYAARAQNRSENMGGKASGNTALADVLSVLSLRAGEARGIVPSQTRVSQGMFDPIVEELGPITQSFVDRLNKNFNETYAHIENTNKRYAESWTAAGKSLEKDVNSISDDTTKGVVRKTFGLDEDFYGTAPTMPRREGGTEVQRARKGIYKTKETNVRSYTGGFTSAVRSMAGRISGDPKKYQDAQFGHVFESIKVPFEKLANDPKVGGAIKRIAKTFGITLVNSAETGTADGIDQASEAASPSQKAKRAGKNISDGAMLGIVDGTKTETAKAKLAGVNVAEAIVKGAREKSQLGPVGATPTQSRLIEQAKPRPEATSRVASPFVQDVKTSFASMRSNIQNEMRMISNDTKSIFEQIKSVFRIGGKSAAEAAKAGLVAQAPQIKVAGRKLGFDYVAALKGGNGAIAAVATKGTQKIVSNAVAEYNKGGFKVAGAISLGFEKGVAGALGRGIVAGRMLAEAEVLGVESVATATTKTKKLEPLDADFIGPEQEGQGRKAAAKGLDTSRIAKFGTAITAATFALSMMPGPIGQFASTLTPILGIVSGLSAVMSALEISVVGGTIAMGSFLIPLWPVIAGLAVLAGGIWAITAAINAANEAEKRKLAELNNTTNAYKNSRKALEEFGKLSGITPGKGMLESARIALATGTNRKTASDAEILLQSSEFKDPESSISKMIGNIKNMSDVAAKNFLGTYANQLKAYGFDDTAINAILTAIKVKASKTNLDLVFADVNISSAKGRNALKKGIEDSVGAIKQEDITKDQVFQKTDAARLAEQRRLEGLAKKTGLNVYKDRAKDIRSQRAQSAAKNPAVVAVGDAAKATSQGIETALMQFKGGSIGGKAMFSAIEAMQKGLGNSAKSALVMKASIAGLKNAAANTAATGLNGLNKTLMTNGKAFDGAANQLKYFSILTANPKMGEGLTTALAEMETKYTDITVRATKTNELINETFNKLNIKTNIDNESLDPITTPGGGDGGSNPADVLKELLEANKAAILNQKLMSQGFGSDFVAMIATADAAVRNYYTDVVKGKTVLNAHGKALLAAYNVKVIKDFQIANTLSLRNIGLEITARSNLAAAVKNGSMTAAQANDFASRAEVQAMYAVAMATKGAVKRKAAIDAVTAALVRQAKAQDALTAAELKTPEEKFNEAYDKASKYLDAKVAVINLEFEMDPDNKANKKAIEDANNAIKDLQTGVKGKIGLDQYNNALSKLQFREDEINKKYDERAKALDKVAKINQKISDQQKGQLTLAQALSSGDIAAAAAAAQELTAQTAAGSIDDQKSALELARQNELDNLTVDINGKKMTRKEIETASKKIEEDILDIQIKQLAPATTALGLAERTRDANIKTWTDQKTGWDAWKVAIDNAALSVDAYNKLVASMPKLGADAGALAPVGNSSGTGGDAVKTATTARDSAKTARDSIQSNIDNFDNPTPANLLKLAQWKKDLEAANAILAQAEVALANAQKAASTTVKKADGGYISGAGTGTSDSIPALLSNGEYVIKAKSVQSLGRDFLDHVNENGTAFADGGFMNSAGYNAGHKDTGSGLIGRIRARNAGLKAMQDLKNDDSKRLIKNGKTTELRLKALQDYMMSNNIAENAASTAVGNFGLGMGTLGSMAMRTGKISPVTGSAVKNNTAGIKDYNKAISSMYTKENVKIDNRLLSTYKMGKNRFAFQGQEQDFSALSKLGVDIVPTTPQGLLNAALKIKPGSLANKKLLKNFEENNIGKKETKFLDKVYASTAFNKNGKANNYERTDGFPQLLAAITGNKSAKNLVNLKTQKLYDTIELNRLKSGIKNKSFDKQSGTEDNAIDPSNIATIHSTKYPVTRDKKGNILLQPHAYHNPNMPTYSRASTHFTLEDTVKSHMFGQWDNTQNKIVSSLSSMMKNNGAPYNLRSVDSWWMTNPGKSLKVSDASVIRPFTDLSSYTNELIKRGLMKPGKLAPIMAVDHKTNDVLHIAKKDYTPVDRIQLNKMLNGKTASKGMEDAAIEKLALQNAKKLAGINSKDRTLGQWGLDDSAHDIGIRRLASRLGSGQDIHDGSMPHMAERPIGHTRTPSNTSELSPLLNIDSMEALRTSVLNGKFKTFEKIIEPVGPRFSRGVVDRLSKGGMVMPKYFADGGMAKGTDVIPAMLTPGEFVINKFAAADLGINRLNALNNGQGLNTDPSSVLNSVASLNTSNNSSAVTSSAYTDASVYNYNVSVNVRSDANPDQIAQAVMMKINSTNSQRIRGNRFNG